MKVKLYFKIFIIIILLNVYKVHLNCAPVKEKGLAIFCKPLKINVGRTGFEPVTSCV